MIDFRDLVEVAHFPDFLNVQLDEPPKRFVLFGRGAAVAECEDVELDAVIHVQIVNHVGQTFFLDVAYA